MDTQYMQQKLYNFTTNALNAYLTVQPSSLSAFMISKTHIVVQKPRRKQVNIKLCINESAILVILFFLCSLFNNYNSRLFRILTVVLAQTASYLSVQLHKHSVSS